MRLACEWGGPLLLVTAAEAARDAEASSMESRHAEELSGRKESRFAACGGKEDLHQFWQFSGCKYIPGHLEGQVQHEIDHESTALVFLFRSARRHQSL